MKHPIMIDLETLDKKPTAAIASIGAVIFDPHSDWIGETFHLHANLVDQEYYGRTIGADTVLWWMAQNNVPRTDLIAGQETAIGLASALSCLTTFIEGAKEVWCNGASFDFSILSSAYHSMGIKAPWSFWQERDLRTLKGLNKTLRIERTGTHHNALDDAIYQARLVQHILNATQKTES